jgi:hypothetical protein
MTPGATTETYSAQQCSSQSRLTRGPLPDGRG